MIPDRFVRNLESGIWNLESNMKLSAIILGVFLWLAGNACHGQDVQVTASIGSDSVGVQDQFQLTVTVSGRDSGDAETPRLPPLNGFRVVAGPSVSTQFQWINGRTSSNKSFTYLLLPEKEGQFTIDPVEVRVGGKAYRSQPLQIRVTSAAPRSASPPRQGSLNRPTPFDPFGDQEDFPTSKPAADAVLVKAELDRSSAYPGQQVTLAYRVYTQVGISGFQIQESPPLSGFWVEDLDVEKNPKGTHQVVNGREYLVFTVKKQALFATTTGKLKIPSSIFAMSADTGGNFFGVFGRAETLVRRTQELSLDVKPLPSAGRPASFNNAVGSFKLSSSVDKTKVATGEAVALQVKLEGQGNLKMIPDISIPALPDLTVYSSKHTDTIRPAAADQIGGSKIWEYVLVPKAPGRQTIPAISFSFFDAGQEKFETVDTSVLVLDVVRGTESQGISGLSGSEKQDLVRRGTDINFIKLSAEDLEETGTPFYRSRWILVLAAIPLLFNVGILVLQRQRSRLSGDARFVRGRKAKHTALQRLRTAEKEGKSDARRFYDQAAAALSGYLSDRFNLPEIELTVDHLERILSQSSIRRETLEETGSCLQECDFGRFVSASASTDKMHSLAERIRANIDELEKTSSQSSPVRFSA
jgi:hypothetical protein